MARKKLPKTKVHGGSVDTSPGDRWNQRSPSVDFTHFPRGGGAGNRMQTVAEYARRHGLTTRAVRYRLENRTLPGLKIARKWYVTRD